MKKERFAQVLGDLDPCYVEQAREKAVRGERPAWRRWAALAACLCLVLSGALAISRLGRVPTENVTTDSVAYGFYLEGAEERLYFPITFEERRQYGLVPEDAAGLSEENRYVITQADLGDYMGTATGCQDETINGSAVYHFASYPEYDAICIVDTPDGYAFYTCQWLTVPEEIGQSFEAVLSVYGLPDSLARTEVLMADERYLSDLEAADSTAIFAILSGTVNDGLEANERRFAQAWYDAYGNDDVHYSEEEGRCVFRTERTADSIVTWTDEAGNTVTANTNADAHSIYDQAQALWTEGERLLRITTDKGFQLMLDYFPSIRTVICGDGYYLLSAEDAAALDALLQIDKS
jgi:hypothetical protein